MQLDLSGKIILITGGSKGIGLACAKAFAAEGAKIAICSRSQDNLDRANAILPGVITISADLTDAKEAAAMIEAVESRLGPVDVLVNSAGAAKRTPPGELTPELWHTGMEAKFFSYINIMDPLIKRMALRKRGVIINVIGSGGRVASPVHLPGGAANAALMLVTAGFGKAYAAEGIRVVGVNPGMTDTERAAERSLTDARLLGITPEEARARSIANIPIGRMASPEEIAQTVVFLASSKASYITSTTITMDGAKDPVVL